MDLSRPELGRWIPWYVTCSSAFFINGLPTDPRASTAGPASYTIFSWCGVYVWRIVSEGSALALSTLLLLHAPSL